VVDNAIDLTKIKVSVIMPIYKAEKYLHKCVETVQGQTHKNIEIILVDDGSPDNCPVICDEYAKKDERIKVVHQKNSGAAAARNTGMDMATGQYIVFVDADDWIEIDIIEALLNVAVRNCADIVKCGFYDTLETQNHKVAFQKEQIYVGKNYGELLKNGCHGGILWSALWNGIYKKDVVKDIRIPSGFINEDNYFSAMMMYHAKKVMVVKECLYHYRELSDSMSSTENKRPLDRGIAYLKLITDLQKLGFEFTKFDHRLATEFYHYILRQNKYVRPVVVKQQLVKYLRKNLSFRRYLLFRYAMLKKNIKVIS